MDKLALETILKNNPAVSEALTNLHREIRKASASDIEAAELLAEAIGQPLYKPPTWGHKSNAPYYQEKYAAQIKKSLLKMDSPAKGDLLLKAREFRVSRKTLRELINQAWRYLIERDSEKDRWRDLRGQIEVGLAPDGILLRWKNGAKTEIEEEFVPHVKHQNMEWKTELEEFIVNAEDGKKLVLTEQRLSEDQIEYIKAICEQTPGLFPKTISMTTVEIIKNLSLWKRMNEE